jgi:hypothetical protein
VLLQWGERLCRAKSPESGKTYPGAICLGPQIIAIHSHPAWKNHREPSFSGGESREIRACACDLRSSRQLKRGRAFAVAPSFHLHRVYPPTATGDARTARSKAQLRM